MEGAGSQIWHRRSLGDFNALQTCSKHLVNRSEWRRNDKATPTYEYQTMKHKYCITPSVFIFEQDRDNFLITYFGAQRQNNI